MELPDLEDSLSLPASAPIVVKGTMLDKIATRKPATGVRAAFIGLFFIGFFISD
jgi:hypothetical protein